uniref:hypothetical protein n=1 Tax=Brucella pseudintermedia TaxID=370111 RepID=UPI00158ED02F
DPFTIAYAQARIGSPDIQYLEVVAVHEDFNSIKEKRPYREALYRAADGSYFIQIVDDLFAVNRDSAFSWLNKRGFNDWVIDLYCDQDMGEIAECDVYELPEVSLCPKRSANF